MAGHNKENETQPRPHGRRVRRVTDRLQKTREAASAAADARRKKKQHKAQRLALRQRQKENSLAVERPGDTAEVRELRAALVRMQGERNAAEAAASRPARHQGPASRSIARPKNMSKITISDIRAALDLSGAHNDLRWSDIRADVRRFMDAGLLDPSIGWKEQDNRRLAKVYDAIEAAYPDLERFPAQWATAFFVHETFGGQKTYKNCKSKEGTYRERTRRTRRSDSTRLRADSPDNTTFGGAGPRPPSHSPNSSPSPTGHNSKSTSRAASRDRSRSGTALPMLTPEPDAPET
ncbi:hypothetical protein MVEN_00659600 [Mycena venus]|uniref:Uncharacterized protein n=1 Tax=Mycena venus TaxID=2733690 RepID=A0A8H6YQ14_9AGAR|nr:hypothetical protein MVEN_00659600 [Mycena venus]